MSKNASLHTIMGKHVKIFPRKNVSTKRSAQPPTPRSVQTFPGNSVAQHMTISARIYRSSSVKQPMIKSVKALRKNSAKQLTARAVKMFPSKTVKM